MSRPPLPCSRTADFGSRDPPEDWLVKAYDGDSMIDVALTHYSPVVETLAGEPPEIFPFLGNSLMAHAIDGAGIHVALHGHAHKGGFHGATAGGVPVRNVARQVIDRPYVVLELDEDGLLLTQQLGSPATPSSTRLGEGSRG